jgi:hypothetical protein
MMVLWDMNQVQDKGVELVPVYVPSNHVPIKPIIPLKPIIDQSTPVKIYNKNTKQYLNITNRCTDISLNPSLLCLKWENKIAAYQYSTFILYYPNSTSKVLYSNSDVLLYAPYLNLWFSNTNQGSLTKMEPTKFIKINNVLNDDKFIREDTDYKFNITNNDLFKDVTFNLTKIIFS